MLGIVILNYLNWWDTVELIETIKKQTFNNYHVIIVDNHSQNDSVTELEKLYKNEEKIHLLEAHSNEGFARGNNIGIEYAVNQLNTQDVLLLNNDTLMLDSRYLEELCNIKYDKTVGAIGTKILDANDNNQNPLYGVNSLKEACEGLLRSTHIFKIIRPLLKSLRKLIITLKVKATDENTRVRESKRTQSGPIILHGSAMLLTKNYLKLYLGLYPETFMFFEENILDILLKKNFLHAEYHEKLIIKHKEDQSSILAFDDVEKRKQKMLVNSWYEFLKLNFMSKNRIKKHFLNHTNNSTLKF